MGDSTEVYPRSSSAWVMRALLHLDVRLGHELLGLPLLQFVPGGRLALFKLGVALDLLVGPDELGLGAGKPGPGQVQVGLEGPGVDAEQDLVFL